MEISYILATATIILLIYLFNNQFNNDGIYNYWKKQGIPTVPHTLPFLGDAINIFISHKTFGTFLTDVYETYKSRSMVGFFQFRTPTLVLRDPEVIKTVLQKEFSKFEANATKVDPELDPLLAHNPFVNYGEKWKILRNRLSRGFMSTKKLRILAHGISQVCVKLSKYLSEQVEQSKGRVYETEAKDLGNLFTGEIVANIGFGVEGDFFSGGSGPNSFREAVGSFLKPTLYNRIAVTIFFFIPSLSNIMRASFMPPKMDRFFRKVVHEVLEHRRKDGVSRFDFLQLMIDDQKSDDPNGKIDELNLTANAASFFVDGYETSGITLAFFLYLIAEHPEVQNKVREEITTVLSKHNGEITYESLLEMKYLDKALDESMRMYPAAPFLTKVCNERYKLVGNDGLECYIEPGMQVMIPVNALQRDPEYWDNPEIYDPERFSDESKKERPKMVYMPFGEGPRICVGIRFAIMVIKAAIATVLKDFIIEPSPKTKLPLQFKKGTVVSTIDGGLWVKFRAV